MVRIELTDEQFAALQSLVAMCRRVYAANIENSAGSMDKAQFGWALELNTILCELEDAVNAAGGGDG